VPAVHVRGLRKNYGELEAVRGIDLDVTIRDAEASALEKTGMAKVARMARR